MLRILALLLVILTGGLYAGNRFLSKSDFHLTPYPDLKRNLLQTKKALVELDQYKPKPEEFVSYKVTKGVFEKDIIKIKKEIKFRQLNLGLALAAVAMVLLTLIGHLIAYLRFGSTVGVPVKGFFHSGRVEERPSRVETIDPEELNLKLLGGYPERKKAELWLRTDEFLRCPTCDRAAKIALIGAVQETVFFEEIPRGVSKDQVKQLGHKWVAIPIDEYKCEGCGQMSYRRHR